MAEGNQLLLTNLTFETSSNFSCKVKARSVPGLEQSKQVAVAVKGKDGCGVSSVLLLSAPSRGEKRTLTVSPRREAAHCGHQRPAVRAAG